MPTVRNTQQWSAAPDNILYRTACQLHDLGKFQDEAALLERLLSISRDDKLTSHAGLVLGAHYMEEGQWQKAIEALKHVKAELGDATTFPKAAWALLSTGRCHVELGDFASANRVFESANTLPGSPRMAQQPIQKSFEALMGAAKAKTKPTWPSKLGPQEGDPVEDLFRRGCRWARPAEIDIREESGLLGFAVMEGRERKVRAIALLNEIVSKHPTHPRAVTAKRYLADVYLGMGELDQALKLYQQVKENKGADERDRAWCAFRAAICLAAKGQKDEAELALRRATAEFPNAEFFRELGAGEITKEYLDHFAEGWLVRPDQDRDRRDFDYERESSGFVQAGYLLMSMGEEDLAVPILAGVCENYKEGSTAAIARTEMGKFHLRKREWKKAAEYLRAVGEVEDENRLWGAFEEAGPSYPTAAEAAFLAGYALVMAGEYGEARTLLSEAVRLHSGKRRFEFPYPDQFSSIIAAAKEGKAPTFPADAAASQRGEPAADEYYRAMDIYRAHSVTLAECKNAAGILDRLSKKPLPPALACRAKFGQGLIRMTMEEWPAAAAIFEDVEKKYADVPYEYNSTYGPFAAHMAGKCRANGGQFDEAKAAFALAEKKYPGAKFTYKPWRKWFADSIAAAEQRVPFSLAKASDDMLEPERAMELANKAVGFWGKDPEKAILLSREVIAKYPETYSAGLSYYRIGSICWEQKRYREAAEAFSGVVEGYVGAEIPRSDETMAEPSSWFRANMALMAGDEAQAKTFYEFAMKTYPYAIMPFGQRMGTPMRQFCMKDLMKLGLVNPKEELKKEIDFEKAPLGDLMERLRLLRDLEEYGEALRVSEAVFKRAHNHRDACNELMSIIDDLQRAERLDEAIRATQIIEENCPDARYTDHVLYAAEAAFKRARFLSRKGEPEKARQAFEEACKKYPKEKFHGRQLISEYFRRHMDMGTAPAPRETPPPGDRLPVAPVKRSGADDARVNRLRELCQQRQYDQALDAAEKIFKETGENEFAAEEVLGMVDRDVRKSRRRDVPLDWAMRAADVIEKNCPSIRYGDGVLFAAHAAFCRVEFLVRMGQEEKATEAFEEASRKYPTEKWHNGTLCTDCFKQFLEARSIPTRRQPPGAKPDAPKDKAEPPKAADADISNQLTRLKQLGDEGKYEEALRIAEEIFKQSPDHNQTARAVLVVIGQSAEAKDFDAAIRGTEVIEANCPNLRYGDKVLFAAEAAFRRVALFAAKGDEKRAKEAYEQASKKYPNERWHGGQLFTNHFRKHVTGPSEPKKSGKQSRKKK